MPVPLDALAGFPGMSEDPEARKNLAAWLDLRHFGAGEQILKQGDHANDMFVIRSGRVEFYTQDATGKEKIFQVMQAGEAFGEAAVLDKTQRSAFARVARAPADAQGRTVQSSDAFLWRLPKEHIEEVLRQNPEFAILLLKSSISRMVASGMMFRDTVMPSIQEQLKTERSLVDQRIQHLVHRVGTVGFLWANLILCVIWIILNKMVGFQWDTEALEFLGLFLAVEALVLTVLVLIKQNRDEADADRRANIILANSQTTEQEIKHLRAKIDTLVSELEASGATWTAPDLK